eukprot:1412843-Rhodomonas_salina.1
MRCHAWLQGRCCFQVADASAPGRRLVGLAGVGGGRLVGADGEDLELEEEALVEAPRQLPLRLPHHHHTPHTPSPPHSQPRAHPPLSASDT